MHFIADYQTSLKLALKARYSLLAVWLLLVVAGSVILGAQFSGRQPATVGLDVGLSALRLLLPILAALLAQELIAKEFERRYYLTSLTYPRQRYQFLLGRLLSIFTLIIALLVVMAGLIAILVWYISQDYSQATPVALGTHYLVTISFIALDLFILTCMGAFIATVATTPSFILVGTIGFMLIGRSYATIIALVNAEHDVVNNPELYSQSLKMLGYIIPDLAALDVRMISLYGTMEFLPANWPVMVLGVLSYGFALIGLSLWALQRKHFS